MMAVNEINTEQLKQWQDQNRTFRLLDVRTRREMEQAMIPGGKPLEINDIEAELGAIEIDEELVVYCRSGIRSRQVCEYLIKRGYGNVYNLSGGIIDWHQRGFNLTDLSAI